MPVNSVQFGQTPWKYANGLGLSNNATTPNTLLDVAVGSILDFDGVFQLTLSAPVSVNSAVNGLNGLDTGTIAINTLYKVYLVADVVSGLPTGVVLSTAVNATGPVMPFGYNKYARIGFVATNGTAQFIKGYWTAGNSSQREFFYDAPVATAVTAGNATAFTAIPLTATVPTIDNTPVMLSYAFTPGAASRTFNLTPGGGVGNALTVTGQVTSVVNSGVATVVSKVIATVPQVLYKVSNSGDAVAVNVAGYTFFI